MKIELYVCMGNRGLKDIIHIDSLKKIFCNPKAQTCTFCKSSQQKQVSSQFCLLLICYTLRHTAVSSTLDIKYWRWHSLVHQHDLLWLPLSLIYLTINFQTFLLFAVVSVKRPIHSLQNYTYSIRFIPFLQLSYADILIHCH